jgi:colanic acid/amylovoran biosynthesis glycosyltransferase
LPILYSTDYLEGSQKAQLGAHDYVILHLMSTFPSLTETFVMREIRQLGTDGWSITIGQLRPLHKTPPAEGFEDLVPLVSPATWVSFDLLTAILFYCAVHRARVWSCLQLVSKAKQQPKCLLKMLYVLLSSMRLAFRFRNSPPSLVRAHFLHTEALGARFVSTLLTAPYTVTVYTAAVIYPKEVIQDIVQNAAFLVADTHQVRHYLGSFGAKLGPEYVIHNSVDLVGFPARCQYQTNRPATILAVGRLDAKKGFDVLIAACSILHKRGIEFHCMIVGDGLEWENLIALRSRLEMDERVEMVGKLAFSQVRCRYYTSDIFAMPSVVTSEGETDGMPTVVIEAMASGLPIVATRIAGIPEAVRDGLNGFLVPSNDSEGLADRLALLIERQELRERFGRESRNIAESEFDLKRKSSLLSKLMLHHLSEGKCLHPKTQDEIPKVRS